MKTLKDLEDKEKGRNALIIGAGSSIKTEKSLIDKFIKDTDPILMGINNMTDYWVPNYHLWTNTQRFRTFKTNISVKSNLLLGSKIPLKIAANMNYTLINYSDREGTHMSYKNGKISGFFRTAGCLAVMILHLMSVKEINICGMDGYSLHRHEELLKGEKSQHCYGEGLTDTATWETCIKKDKLIDKALRGLKEYGIEFKIITPTKYRSFYDSTRLYS